MSGDTATYSTSALNLGGHSVTAEYAGDSSYDGSTSSALTQTVDKANPSVTTWPTATAITYGQTLASSTLSAGAVTPTGNFTWTTPSTVPGAGTASQGVTFTPNDTDNYNPATGTASVTVNAAGTTNLLVSSSNPSLPGANVTFTAKVGAVTPGSGIYRWVECDGVTVVAELKWIDGVVVTNVGAPGVVVIPLGNCCPCSTSSSSSS